MPGRLTHGHRNSCEKMSDGGRDCSFRGKDSTENCSNPGITFLISFSLFFILHLTVGTNKSHGGGLCPTHHPRFLSREVVLRCSFGWAFWQFPLLPEVSSNKRRWFSQPFGGLFLIPHHYDWFFSLPFPQHLTRPCFAVCQI